MFKERDKLKLKPPCKKQSLLERLFRTESLHNWQSRGINRYGLSTYEVCLKCGEARERNKIGEYPTFMKCDRIKELDDQFDEKGNYIYNL